MKALTKPPCEMRLYCIADAVSCIYIVKGREVGGGAGYGYFNHQTTQQ